MAKRKMSAATAQRRGYVLESTGIWRKRTVLEKYFEEGCLELANSPFSAEQRKEAGEILARDYYLGNYDKLQSVKLENMHIKSTAMRGVEMCLYYKERYLRAIKSIPYEFWPTVYKVCILDSKIEFEKEKNYFSLDIKNKKYCQKVFLCLGLERLLKFYLQENKKSS